VENHITLLIITSSKRSRTSSDEKALIMVSDPQFIPAIPFKEEKYAR
jgi:hypothetical protein